MSTFIIIPAYNEEKSIANVIEGLLNSNYTNIVVVNDGSIDDTSKIVKKYPVYLVDHIVNLGQGASLKTGMDFALRQGAQNLIHFDADGQHLVSEIALFLEKLNQGYEVVMGSRFLGGKQNMPWTKKYFILKPGIWVNWLFTGVMLTDVHNGFRALTRKAAQTIKITQNGMAHASEIPQQVFRHKLTYTEVPVEIQYNDYGQRMSGGVKIIFDLLKKNFIS